MGAASGVWEMTEIRKIIVAVAPVGRSVPDGVFNPVTPEQVAAETISCNRAGASLVHLHVRDEHGRQTEDLAAFAETLDGIRQVSDIILQVSTGGLSSLTLEQRCAGLNEPRVETASLNMGSVNFGEEVYINTLPDIRYWAGRMCEVNVMPELEIFEAGMIHNAKILIQEGVLRAPFNFGFALGFKGALPADAGTVAFLRTLLPVGSHWGVVHEGMRHLSLLAGALSLGATVVRCGFEDGVLWSPDRPAKTNTELVEKVVALVRLMGFDVASSDEARLMLGIGGTLH